MAIDILKKIKQANLIGRGGASFPAAIKWDAVKKAKGQIKYIVVNAAEGEPGIKKDGFILANYPEVVLTGVKEALNFLNAKQIYFYINHDYFKKYSANLKKIAKKLGIDKQLEFFIKPKGATYIAGEESAILNLIEGKKMEPRLRPPLPVEHGLFGAPTLINNVETFYNVGLVAKNEFYDLRFYTISGAVKNPGVYYYPAKWTIKMILDESNNYPHSPFFAQVGGEMSGEILNDRQLDRQVAGSGGIMVYDLARAKHEELLLKWFNFYTDNSCGQCVPCREGTYRLLEMVKAGKLDLADFAEIIKDLEESSFCALGSSLPIPVNSYFKNVAPKIWKK